LTLTETAQIKPRSCCVLSSIVLDNVTLGRLTYDQEVVGSTPCEVAIKWLVTTSMGDCQRTGKPSRYITNHPAQLSLLSLRGIGQSSTGPHEGTRLPVSDGM